MNGKTTLLSKLQLRELLASSRRLDISRLPERSHEVLPVPDIKNARTYVQHLVNIIQPTAPPPGSIRY